MPFIEFIIYRYNKSIILEDDEGSTWAFSTVNRARDFAKKIARDFGCNANFTYK